MIDTNYQPVQSASPPQLRRALGVWSLTFYGLGVTVGAGIFALVGEISGMAGDHAPLAFGMAGLLAGTTAVSYSRLARIHPVAAGEAVYVRDGFGVAAGRIAGLAVAITGIVSSAVLATAFAGYLGHIVAVPGPVLTIGILALLGIVAWRGVRESVYFAAFITILEVGTLAVIAAFGLPELGAPDLAARVAAPPLGAAGWAAVTGAALVAFFAFVGFEDIVNMAEETIEPERTVGRAIALTLAVTTILYVGLAVIAVAVSDRLALAGSPAPMADLFAFLSGRSGAPVAAIASIAMVNGILVQIVMASRVIYGMANTGLLPKALATLDPDRLTPVRAIAFVCVFIAALALAVPLLTLAQATSTVILGVFTLVNLSLWRIASRAGSRSHWRHWGAGAGALTAALLAFALFG